MRAILISVALLLATVGHAGEHAADATLSRLARAFEAKDRPAIEREILDPWSGSRFLASFDEASWKDATHALRGAKPGSRSADRCIYVVKIRGQQREVTVVRRDEHWLLDYNSFLGPFPTF